MLLVLGGRLGIGSDAGPVTPSPSASVLGYTAVGMGICGEREDLSTRCRSTVSTHVVAASRQVEASRSSVVPQVSNCRRGCALAAGSD